MISIVTIVIVIINIKPSSGLHSGEE